MPAPDTESDAEPDAGGSGLRDLTPLLGPELAGALEKRGFTELTTVQEAVLDPAFAGRDLRLTSQTGSGKTVAIGLAVRHAVVGDTAAVSGAARPRVLVVAPTRELAHQVEEELSWLFAPLGVRVVTTTGGSSARDERRALGTGPAVVVGTPGRLLDHLSRKSIDPSQVAAVVLDEADRMLDLGFREDLTAILGYPPPEHRTHLVSATFPHVVKALADSVQQDPVHVEGTRLGAANVDIVHRIVLVDLKEKVGAVINILLAKPEEQALVFARTRADVASLARELSAARFSVGSLSGEMDQVARNRAMAAFKSGALRVLVATDVAARGIDVQDIAHVIHADAPGDSDTYTHRSGRTGRAGRKGMSTVLVTPSGLRGASYLLTRAGVRFRVEPVPSADEIRKAADERLFTELTASNEGDATLPERVVKLAARLADSPEVARTLSRLLARVRSAEASEPRELRRIDPPSAGDRGERPRGAGGDGERPRHAARDLPRAPTPGKPLPRPSRDYGREPGHDARAHASEPRAKPRPSRADDGREWAPFRVTWGAEQGADARRLLAIVCRRGGIRGSDVGAIRVGTHSSTVAVAADVAKGFAEAVAVLDPREPNVVIAPDRMAGQSEAPPLPPQPPRPPREETPRPRPTRPREDSPRPHEARERAPEQEAPERRPAPDREHDRRPAPAAPREGLGHQAQKPTHYKPSTDRPAHKPPFKRDGFKGDPYKPGARAGDAAATRPRKEHERRDDKPGGYKPGGPKPGGYKAGGPKAGGYKPGGYKGKRPQPAPARGGHVPPKRSKP